jgi:basic membrane lipoprotein Med (substrate-binding protein (PBP1-ABC) superfamily)
VSNDSTNPDLSFSSRADWLAGWLRADRIRLDTLVSLVASWSDPDARDDIINALDALAEVVSSPRAAEGALDAAVEAVEDAAGMDTAQVPIDKTHAMRLHAELSTVVERLMRFGPGRWSVSMPRQRGEIGGAA